MEQSKQNSDICLPVSVSDPVSDSVSVADPVAVSDPVFVSGPVSVSVSNTASVSANLALPKRRQAEEITHRMSRLSTKCNKNVSDTKEHTARPKKQQCSEIAEISSQLSKKLNPTHFTREVHLKPSDPGYGTPQEGTETAVRGRRAHQNISNEIVELAELIWEHGQMTGKCFILTP